MAACCRDGGRVMRPFSHGTVGGRCHTAGMTRIALFHSVLGLRPGVEAAAEVLRAAGHQVRVVDQYDGRVFSDYSEADAFAGTSPRPVAGRRQRRRVPAVRRRDTVDDGRPERLADGHSGPAALPDRRSVPRSGLGAGVRGFRHRVRLTDRDVLGLLRRRGTCSATRRCPRNTTRSPRPWPFGGRWIS